jgi:HEAT repeat protein
MLVTLRKTSKDLAFYPPGHPSLSRSLENAAAQLRAVVDVQPPLTLVVSRAGFTFEGKPVGKENRQLTSMAGELFVRRVHQIFFAQNVSPEELAAFLRMATSDPKQLVQQGGPAKVLSGHAVGRIQVNEFDFRRVGAAAGAGGREAGGTGGGTGDAGKAGAGGSAEGAGPGGSGVGTGTSTTAGAAAGGTAPAGAGTGSPAAGMTPPGVGAASAGGASALRGAGGTPPPGGKEGSGTQATLQGSEKAGRASGSADPLAAVLGSPKDLTVEALIQRLEQEAASGGATGYEWAASRLEKAVGRAIHDDWLKDVLDILRVFLRHRSADDLKAPIRERAAQAMEAVAGGNTASYLIEHLRSDEGESIRELSAVLVGLGARAISPLLLRLTAEDREEVRERLAATLVRFHEASEPDVTRALQGLHRDQALRLVPILAEVGGEAGVALLSCLFRHRDPQVRGEVARELGRSDGPAVQRLIVQALRDPDPAVLEVAIGLAGAAKIKLATPTLLRLAAQRVLTGKSFGLRKAALAALGSMGDPGAVPTLRGALYTRTWFNRAAGDELRQAAALALLAMGRPQARELVVTGSASRRGDVRRACTAALKAAPDKK